MHSCSLAGWYALQQRYAMPVHKRLCSVIVKYLRVSAKSRRSIFFLRAVDRSSLSVLIYDIKHRLLWLSPHVQQKRAFCLIYVWRYNNRHVCALECTISLFSLLYSERVRSWLSETFFALWVLSELHYELQYKELFVKICVKYQSIREQRKNATVLSGIWLLWVWN